ncbi:transglutaminase-like domain-containing protein [Actinospica robiniae]|uniref:transglutaminase-like domain-containing protein n=1 Tax=Actinospica robiniae TaxID=304901 RepID=UPI00054D9FAA|nr:transglutaminase-like domain-containing protein [Actinospica robiniae]
MSSRAPRRAAAGPDPSAVAVDEAFLIGSCALALYALRSTYSGWVFLLAGLAGVLLALAVVRAAAWVTRSVTVAALLATLLYLLLGPLLLTAAAGSGLAAPGVSTVRTAALTAIRCWKQLLTTQPPVGDSAELLAVPLLLGLAGAFIGAVLIRRARTGAAPLAAPLSVLVLAFALGTHSPSNWPVTALALTAGLLVWTALRNHRGGGSVAVRSARALRIAVATVTLLVAGGVAAAAQSSAPGAQGQGRSILRTRVEPPLNVDDYPSPLNGFRKYTKDADLLYSQKLLTVSGLPAGTPLQIAVLDDYNGWVWGAVNPADGDAFARLAASEVPAESDPSAAGPGATVRITVEAGYAAPTDLDVWLPTAGDVHGISLSGPDSAGQTADLWYDSATGSGIVTSGLAAGSTVVLQTTPAHTTLTASDQPYASGTLTDGYQAQFEARAAAWDQGANGPIAEIEAIASYLRRNGAYSDGGAGQGNYLPGHGIGRLTSFLNGQQPVGDDEQYAAALALMAESLGLRSRVVFGAVPEADGVVRGSDVHAWVQVRIVSGAWADIPYTQFMPDPSKAPKPQPKQNTQQSSGTVVPPPDAAAAPNTPVGSGTSTRGGDHGGQHAAAPPGWLGPLLRDLGLAASPLLALLLVAGLIRAVKGTRRKRRRTRGPSADRFAAGWLDLVDHARDLGIRMPPKLTRRQQAERLPDSALAALAATADAAVYGPGDPAEAAVAGYWADLDRARSALSRQAGRRARWRAAYSLASFLPETRRRSRGRLRSPASPSPRNGTPRAQAVARMSSE